MPEAEPFALIEKRSHGLRISAANRGARAAGVMVGAALPDVRAVLPTLSVRPAETERDRHALRRLAAWLGRYGPASNVDGIDGAWVDVTGVSHLFGGEPQLCADLIRRLRRLGLTARIGLADTLGAAHAIARFGRMTPDPPWGIAKSGEAKRVLAELPVAALRLDHDAIQLLLRLGLKRIGQLYGLPRTALAARFRAAGPRRTSKAADAVAASLLMRLDQALGLAGEPRRSLLPPPEAMSRLAFPEPLLTMEGVEETLRRLAAMLERSLEAQALGAQRFRLALYRTDGTVAHATIGTRKPCRAEAHICRLMADRLGYIDAGFGIDVATLEATRLSYLGPHQIGLTEASATDVTAFIDRLAGRLGHRNVGIWTACASHIPERAESWRPAMETEPSTHASSAHVNRCASHAAPARTARRPQLLLSPPEPISVIAELPEGAPQHFVWRRFARRIVKSEGPERIAPEWWRHIGTAGAVPETRDYYRLEDASGARYWVFREGLYASAGEDDTAASGFTGRRMPRWFVHGLFA